MKNTLRHESGLVLTKINIMPYHHKKNTLYPVDKNAHFFLLHYKFKIMSSALK